MRPWHPTPRFALSAAMLALLLTLALARSDMMVTDVLLHRPLLATAAATPSSHLAARQRHDCLTSASLFLLDSKTSSFSIPQAEPPAVLGG